MANVFADSSALVKLYVAESGHEAIREVGGVFVVSQLARVEVPAALWRKHRRGELALDQVTVLATEFEFDYRGDGVAPPRFVAVHLDETLLEEAALLVARHGLRAYDAVQLTTAMAGRVVQPDMLVAAFDEQLRRAAAVEGFGLLPATV